MGTGMAEFLEKKVGSMKEWDLVNHRPLVTQPLPGSGRLSESCIVSSSLQYCHYVAGLVGVGLSKLFSASRLEVPELGQDTELANSMGLFLQKTNIIRDYLEDTQEGRSFWPQEASE